MKKNKYKKIEELFDEIVGLFPDGSANLNIHRIDLTKLDKKVWEIESKKGELPRCKNYAVAKRINKKNTPFDIVLYGEDLK